MENKNFLKSINIYYCGHEQCSKGHSFGPAIRPHYLMHFVLKGKGQYHARGKKFQLEQGDAFLIWPGEFTYYVADDEDPWEYAWVAVDGTEVESILEKCGLDKRNLIFSSRSRHKDEAELIKQKHRVLRLIDMFQENQYNELEMLSVFYGIFSYMTSLEDKEIHTPRETYYKEACAYIDHNYGYDIRIHDVANYIGIDRTYLYKIFMEEKQISPQQYLIQYRLQKAANMLYDTELNITEVAYSCGFKDTPSFCRHFKKNMGVTPRQYKKSQIPFMMQMKKKAGH